MTKNIIIIAVALFLIIPAAHAAQTIYNYYNYPASEIVTNSDLQYSDEGDLGRADGGALDKYQVATTSLEAVASTTEKVFYTYDAEKVDYAITFVPTASNSVLTWKNYFSYDNVTYYGEDIYTVASTTEVTHGPSVATHTWAPGSTGTHLKNISNSDFNAPWTKVVYGLENATGTIAVDIVVVNEQ